MLFVRCELARTSYGVLKQALINEFAHISSPTQIREILATQLQNSRCAGVHISSHAQIYEMLASRGCRTVKETLRIFPRNEENSAKGQGRRRVTHALRY